ncbi:hypothetical protein DFQ30_004830, partial [Apophysomyces sp. BC1015]
MPTNEIPLFQVRGMPTWNSDKETFASVSHFLAQFFKVLHANGVDIEKEWSRFLPMAFPHEYDGWYNSKLAGKSYKWDKVCKAIKKRFETADAIMDKVAEVHTMTMSNDETVTEYGNRFQNACRDSGVQDNEGIATRFLHSLTPSVQTNVRIAWTAQHGKKLPQKIEEVLDIASMVSLGKRIRRSDDEHSPSRPKKNHKKDTKFWCPHHKKQVNHRPQDCRLAKGDAEMTTAEKRYKAGQCIHCGIQWFKGHTCDEYRRAHHDKHQRRVTKDKKVNIIQPANTGNVTEPAHTGIVTEPAHTGIDEHPADSLMDEIDAELEAEFQAS